MFQRREKDLMRVGRVTPCAPYLGFMNGVQRTARPTAVCFRLRFAAFLLGSNFDLMRLDLPAAAKYRW